MSGPEDIGRALRAEFEDALARLPRGGDDEPHLALFELRVRAWREIGSGQVGSFVDGGVRIELGGEACAPAWARYEVAAAPARLPALLGAPAAAPALGGWAATADALLSSALDGLAVDASRLDPLIRRVDAASLRVEKAVETLHVRIWGLARSGLEPLVELVAGRALRVTLAGGARRPRSVGWLGGIEAPMPWASDDPAWRARLDRAAQALARAAASRPPSSLGSALVLLPPAASSLAHELGHAAIEGLLEEGALPSGLALVDDASAAPWPVGGAHDDAGRPTQRVVLAGPGANPGAAALRRAAISDVLRPALSATRLTPVSLSSGDSAAALEEGTPGIEEVTSARLDPLSGSVLLSAPELLVRERGGWRRLERPLLIEARLDELAAALRCPPVEGAAWSDHALCTRSGSVNAVMVGAPTTILHSVRIHPSFPANHRDFRSLT